MSFTQHSRRVAELWELGWNRDAIAAELGASTMPVFPSLKMAAEMPSEPVEPPKPVEPRVTKRQLLLEKSKVVRAQHEASAEGGTSRRGCPSPSGKRHARLSDA